MYNTTFQSSYKLDEYWMPWLFLYKLLPLSRKDDITLSYKQQRSFDYH